MMTEKEIPSIIWDNIEFAYPEGERTEAAAEALASTIKAAVGIGEFKTDDGGSEWRVLVDKTREEREE